MGRLCEADLLGKHVILLQPHMQGGFGKPTEQLERQPDGKSRECGAAETFKNHWVLGQRSGDHDLV